jgi:hypothetical protein
MTEVQLSQEALRHLGRIALARALCDSSSHMNLLPRAEQRPCDYHIKRAADTLELLRARASERLGDPNGMR